MAHPLTIRGWTLDLEDPRAPTEAEWAAMTEEERAQVVASLPADPAPLQGMGESDTHYDAVDEARRGLRRLFDARGRSVYVGAGLSVYYPGEATFAPDVFAVLDVPTHGRSSWVVAKEKRGLDLAIEVCVAGDRRKDTVADVARYARLGITEYFVLQPERGTLNGHRLEGTTQRYVALAPQRGRLKSRVLDLELEFENGLLRFFTQGAPLPFQQELIHRLEHAVDAQFSRVTELELALEEERRALEEERKALEEERKAREEERKAREDTERALAEARAELARLRGQRDT